MALSSFRLREGLRKVYRESSTESGRETYLDGLSDVALAAVNSGKVLVTAGAGGTSSGYSVFNGWASADVLEFVDWARSHIAGADIDTELADVPARIRRFQTNTTNLRVVG